MQRISRCACQRRKDDRDAVKVMRRLVSSYFRVVLSTTKDMVPKIIMKYVVLHTEKTVHDHLITNLLKYAPLATHFFQPLSCGSAAQGFRLEWLLSDRNVCIVNVSSSWMGVSA